MVVKPSPWTVEDLLTIQTYLGRVEWFWEARPKSGESRSFKSGYEDFRGMEQRSFGSSNIVSPRIKYRVTPQNKIERLPRVRNTRFWSPGVLFRTDEGTEPTYKSQITLSMHPFINSPDTGETPGSPVPLSPGCSLFPSLVRLSFFR